MAGHTVIVVNPQSQRGAVGRRWPDLARRIRHKLAFEEMQTQAPGDATRLARRALEGGADQVVALGGDGTINEVANGFFVGERPVRREAALGILPFGTGGDFRKTLRIPKNLDDAAATLARGITRVIDVGLIEYSQRSGETARRIFVNIASFGISGVVDRLVNEGPHLGLGGRLSFLVATARAGLQYQNQRVRLTFDDSAGEPIDMTINTVAVANGRYFGGGMFIAPQAELDDGYFDVVALGDVGIADMLLSGHRLYRGTHLELDKVSVRRAKRMRAEAQRGEIVELDVDGETPGILPATFRLLPAALRVVVPG